MGVDEAAGHGIFFRGRLRRIAAAEHRRHGFGRTSAVLPARRRRKRPTGPLPMRRPRPALRRRFRSRRRAMPASPLRRIWRARSVRSSRRRALRRSRRVSRRPTSPERRPSAAPKLSNRHRKARRRHIRAASLPSRCHRIAITMPSLLRAPGKLPAAPPLPFSVSTTEPMRPITRPTPGAWPGRWPSSASRQKSSAQGHRTVSSFTGSGRSPPAWQRQNGPPTTPAERCRSIR